MLTITSHPYFTLNNYSVSMLLIIIWIFATLSIVLGNFNWTLFSINRTNFDQSKWCDVSISECEQTLRQKVTNQIVAKILSAFRYNHNHEIISLTLYSYNYVASNQAWIVRIVHTIFIIIFTVFPSYLSS